MPASDISLQLAHAAESLFADAQGVPNAGHARNVLARQQEALEAALRAHIRPAAPGPLVVIYDVEGTTTPLPFVTKVLFPYSQQHMGAFVETHVTDDVLDAVDTANKTTTTTTVTRSPSTGSNRGGKRGRREDTTPAKPDASSGTTAAPASSMVTIASDALAASKTPAAQLQGHDARRAAITTVLLDAVAANLKVPYLKQSQGMIWRHGYEGGALRGQLFDDAAVAMRRLGRSGAGSFGPRVVSQHIYSSGSVAAQQLLFQFSSHGDITPCIAGYHDPTLVGPKTDGKSYDNLKRRIAGTLLAHESTSAASPNTGSSPRYATAGSAKYPNVDTDNLKGIVFVTDSLQELRAANAAGGILGILSVRPCNAPLPKSTADFREALGGDDSAPQLSSIVTFDQLVDALGRVLVEVEPAQVAIGSALAEVAPLVLAPVTSLKSFT